MRAFDIPFTEKMVMLDEHVKIPELKGISPTGKVPCLVDGDVTVWDGRAGYSTCCNFYAAATASISRSQLGSSVCTTIEVVATG
jgi:hypothetical protein